MTVRLSASSYVVLALIARNGPMTPYELKSAVAEGVGQFWALPHAQSYRDPPRLAELGLLHESTEEGGRRRRRFHLTPAGERALRDWLATPDTDHVDLHDPALVKLSFAEQASAEEIGALAGTQIAKHAERLQLYSVRQAGLDTTRPAGAARERLLDFAIRYERMQVEFWEDVRAHAGDRPR
jgi:DNA-binding PadR family transcriptional regulator